MVQLEELGFSRLELGQLGAHLGRVLPVLGELGGAGLEPGTQVSGLQL
jgi:hypothetical protein